VLSYRVVDQLQKVNGLFLQENSSGLDGVYMIFLNSFIEINELILFREYYDIKLMLSVNKGFL